MADKTIGELVSATTIGDSDLFVLQQDGVAKNITGETVANYIYAASGATKEEIDELLELFPAIKATYGAPLVASTVADMTDHTHVYVYTGSETGYTSGNWYYWDGSAWVSGGIYNSTAFTTDKTLTIPGAAADAAVIGGAISKLLDTELFRPAIRLNSYWSSETGEPGPTSLYFARTEYKYNTDGRVAVWMDSDEYDFGLGFFDSNGDVINFVLAAGAPNIQYIPQNAAQFVINFKRKDGAKVIISDREKIRGSIRIYTTVQMRFRAEEACEPGGLESENNNGAKSNNTDCTRYRSRTLYTCPDGEKLQLTVKTGDVCVLYYYKSDFTVLSTVTRSFSNGALSVIVPTEAAYFSFYVRNSDNSELTNFSSVTIDSSGEIIAVKYPDFSEYYKNPDGSFSFCYETAPGILASGRLRLPRNYTIDGDPVPLIVWVHGSASITNWNDYYRQASWPNFAYLQDEGFAVFDCYPWTNKYALENDTWSPYCIPVHKQSYIAGIRYVCSRYNIDIGKVVLVAKSQGGNLGHWATIEDEFPFKAVALFAPSTDIVSGNATIFGAPEPDNTANRAAVCRYVDFAGTQDEISAFINRGTITNAVVDRYVSTGEVDAPSVMSFLVKNKAKITSMYQSAHGVNGAQAEDIFVDGLKSIQYAPQWMLDIGLPEWQSGYDNIPAFAEHNEYSKNARRPVKFWASFDDAQTSTYANYAIHQWMLNGGSDSEFRVLPNGTGGHNSMDTSPLALRTSGTTALGIAYTNIPVAFVELVEFFRRNLAM